MPFTVSGVSGRALADPPGRHDFLSNRLRVPGTPRYTTANQAPLILQRPDFRPWGMPTSPAIRTAANRER